MVDGNLQDESKLWCVGTETWEQRSQASSTQWCLLRLHQHHWNRRIMFLSQEYYFVWAANQSQLIQSSFTPWKLKAFWLNLLCVGVMVHAWSMPSNWWLQSLQCPNYCIDWLPLSLNQLFVVRFRKATRLWKVLFVIQVSRLPSSGTCL
jgi:hypothetical protein